MPTASRAAPSGQALAHVEVWLFDLDNTLYPAHWDLFAQIDARISAFAAAATGVEPAAARAVRRDYFGRYGNTLRGMMLHHDTDPTTFLDYVHDIDLGHMPVDERLHSALDKLPGRKLVFTSASTAHAERILARLGVRSHFEAVFDIEAADYLAKPYPETYRRLIERHDVDPRAAAMVEDIARNLEPAAALGMTTVWVANDRDSAKEGSDGAHVHYVADDLAAWLEALTGEEAAAERG